MTPAMGNANLPLIRVVAAVIAREGKYLITQRRGTAVLPGLWEFPGGKVEPGESDAVALAREIQERISVDVIVGERMALRQHTYVGYRVELNLYRTSIVVGQEPSKRRVADIRWVRSEDFENYPFPAADQATTDLLLGINRA